MILHDWRCAAHGEFEGSHPVCPALGCASEVVVKIFKKAPGMRSDFMKRHDAGIRKSAEMMGLANLRSAREGEAAYGGDVGKPGERVLWGSEVNKVSGQSFAALAAQAEAGRRFKHKDGRVEDIPSGMRQAGQSGLTKRQVPLAERTVAHQDAAKK